MMTQRLGAIVARFIPRGPVWEGIHARASDVPRSGREFGGASWLVPLRAETEGMVDAARRGAPLPEAPPDVAALALVLATSADRPVRVLDFGGGLGTAYLWARDRSRVPLRWLVVETDAVCEAGREVHRHDEAIWFASSAKGAEGRFDVVHVRSALQYADDWEATLRELAGKRARLVLLHKLTAGDVPTFATAQLNVPGTRIPYWFLNEADVVRVMDEAGYALASRARGGRLPPMANFPPTHRLERTLDLAFVRRE